MWLAKFFVGGRHPKFQDHMASNEASQAHTHVSSYSNHGVPNQYTRPQIIFTRGHASWEKGKTLLTQKEIDWMCVLVRDVFKWVFNSHCTQSPRFCSKRIFLYTCKCHPVRFSVITIIGSCTSTPTPKLILHVATRAGKKEKLCWRKKK